MIDRVFQILLANSFYTESGKEYHKLPACSYCADISEIASCTFYKGIRQQYLPNPNGESAFQFT